MTVTFIIRTVFYYQLAEKDNRINKSMIYAQLTRNLNNPEWIKNKNIMKSEENYRIMFN